VKKFFPNRSVYLPNPTWENHKNILIDSQLDAQTYAYYDPKTKGLDIDGYLKSIHDAPEGSVFLLHAIAHNPTGVDPTPEQWNQIAKAIQQKKIIPYFDSAYQGFASGSLEKDSYAVSLWDQMGMEFFIAQSFAKNFGLYGTRTGAFHVVTRNPKCVTAVQGQLKRIVRAMYSNPPNYGARIISLIVHTPELHEQWKKDMIVMSDRLKLCRKMLYDELVKLGTPGDWTHIVKQIGMFTYTGLSVEQVEALIEQHHVFLLKSGRVSLAGLNTKNVGYVAKAIDTVVRANSKL
jgi:aspartate/tyrosine/aromatic aminotransferase